jgi:hypothetical protein
MYIYIDKYVYILCAYVIMYIYVPTSPGVKSNHLL